MRVAMSYIDRILSSRKLSILKKLMKFSVLMPTNFGVSDI